MANNFKRYTSRGVGTTATAVGSAVAADTQVTVIGLSLANVLTTLITASVILNDGTNDTYIVKDMDIVTGGSQLVVGGDQKVVLETGDTIKVVSSDDSSIDVIMSVLEIT